MITFYKIKQLKLKLCLMLLLKYSFWALFFIYQGRAISLAIDNHSLSKQIIFTLAVFILLKMMVMLCDVLQKYFIENAKNISLKILWQDKFPAYLYKDNKTNKNDMNLLFFDLLPKIFDLEVGIISNYCSILFIFALTISIFLYNGFYFSILVLATIFFLNFLSKNICTKRINDYLNESISQNVIILNWVDQYFDAYKEISKNWQGIIHSNWKDQIYLKYFLAKKYLIFYHFIRDLLSQFLVEFPFLLTTSIVIVGVHFNYLTITQLFIWIGFSQFMINASNAYLDNRVKIKQRIVLYDKTSVILRNFQQSNFICLEKTASDHFSFSEVILRDGVKNTLSLNPGIYHIQGQNGSGKSTLLNMILKYDRSSDFFINTHLSSLIVSVNDKNIRIIEKDAVIFDCLNYFDKQVCGPLIIDDEFSYKINFSLMRLLEPATVGQWRKIFAFLESEYLARQAKIMSSGEKVILSLMRFFASWNDKVKLLVIDECDAFLDFHKKELFKKTIHELSQKLAVYICTHNPNFLSSKSI